MANRSLCVIPYSDGGKTCSDKSDCTGLCVIDLGKADYSEAELAKASTGKCQLDDKLFGCYAVLAKGKIVEQSCRD